VSESAPESVQSPSSVEAASIEAAPPEAPPPSARSRKTRVLAAGAAIVIVLIALAAALLWGPALIHQPLSGEAQRAAEPAKPLSQTPPAPDPAITALKTQASQNAAELQQLAQRIAMVEAKPAPPAADLGPIEQQLAALSKTAADLAQRVTSLEAAMQAQPALDPKNTAMALVLLQIREAVDIGRPFDAEYQALAALARDHPDIAAAAAPLAGSATSGVASRAVLVERLRQLAPQIATAEPPPEATWKSQIVAQLRKLVTIRRIDGDELTPAEAAVSAAQRDVASGDIGGAVAALSGLSGPNQAAAAPWLKMAKERLAVEAALRQTAAALTAALGNPVPAGKG
jgi:hypothetical protein